MKPEEEVVELAPGFRLVVHANGVRRLECTDVEKLIDALGEPLFAGIARCFEGAERTAAIEQFIGSTVWLGPDPLASARNLRVAFFLMVGTLFEVQNALGDLRRLGIRGTLSDPTPWDELDEMRKRWARPELRGLRNHIAFHMTPDLAARGVASLREAAAPAVLLAFRKPSKLNTVIPFAPDILLRGLELDDRDVSRLLAEVTTDATALSRKVTALFLAVLADHGMHVHLPPAELRLGGLRGRIPSSVYRLLGETARRAARTLWQASWRWMDDAATIDLARAGP